jgi:hypothetical protein
MKLFVYNLIIRSANVVTSASALALCDKLLGLEHVNADKKCLGAVFLASMLINLGMKNAKFRKLAKMKNSTGFTGIVGSGSLKSNQKALESLYVLQREERKLMNKHSDAKTKEFDLQEEYKKAAEELEQMESKLKEKCLLPNTK